MTEARIADLNTKCRGDGGQGDIVCIYTLSSAVLEIEMKYSKTQYNAALASVASVIHDEKSCVNV